MNITKKRVKEDFNRDTYWTRIHFESDDKKHESTVLVCASWEYLMDTNRINEVKDNHLDQWREAVIRKWNSLGNKIFNKKVHYDIYANTPEGEINGLEFLKTKT